MIENPEPMGAKLTDKDAIIRQLRFLNDELHEKQKGKTLIGTCGDCRWWENGSSISYAKCRNPDNHRLALIGYIQPHFDFGCIHWKEKL